MDTFSPSTIYRWAASCIVLVIFKVIVDKVLSLRRAFERIKDCPGRLPQWINPLSPIGIALGHTFPRPGMSGYCGEKFSLHKQIGATCYASIELSSAQPYFWCADHEAMKIITSDRHVFRKNAAQYKLLDIYGGNVVISEGSDWKRHRSIAMSAFNEANVAMVWTETMRLVNEWFERLDVAGTDLTLDIVKPMMEMTLRVIVSASFGQRLSLTTDAVLEPPPGRKLTFQSAVLDSVSNVVFKAIVPKWFYQLSSLIRVPYLSSRAQLTQLAFDDLRYHMLDLVASASADITSGKHSEAKGTALLRNLVEANMNQDGDSKKLTEAELLSNIFTFLLAGHETSSHTLSFAFVLLALHPECQQKLYEEVTRVWPTDVPIAQSTTIHRGLLDKLEYTVACIHETLRVLPVAPRIPRVVHTDTVLPGTYFVAGSKDSPSVETGKFSMAVPAGSTVVLHIWGLHMNPLYWGEDAEAFKPERFIDTESYQWPRHAYLPFSGGSRSCIGQRFALTEMVGIVASVVRRYRILVPDDVANKSFEEQKDALLSWTSGITTIPLNARVKLCRRV